MQPNNSQRTLCSFSNALGLACLCALTTLPSYAQEAPGAAVQRNILQNWSNIQRPAGSDSDTAARSAAPTEEDIARFAGVNAEAPADLPEVIADIRAYWASQVGTAVSGTQVAQFKAWLWQRLKAKGYLAYITTTLEPAQATPQGQWLVVKVTTPTIGRVTFVAMDDAGARVHVEEVARRFNRAFPPGLPVDVQGIESQLEAMAYDLPVKLEAVLTQPDEKTIHVAVGVAQVEHQPGKLLDAVVQTNNYGLPVYGRGQILGQVRLAGLTPQSEASLTAQGSSGVNYLRGEYRAPLAGLRSQIRGWASATQSQANSVRGDSTDLGLGLQTLVHASRDGTVVSVLEAAHRENGSRVADVVQRARSDDQARLALRTVYELDSVGSLSSEVAWVGGNLQLRPDDLEFSAATGEDQAQGRYQKLELSGTVQKVLDDPRQWTGSVRWRGQWTDKRLDSYHQLSLGGISGIRAYSTEDGVGDQGFQMSLDLIRQMGPHFWLGALYDVGVIRPSLSAGASAYSLQGAGLQMGGSLGLWSWNLSVAQSFGSTPDVPNALSSTVGQWRGNFALTYKP